MTKSTIYKQHNDSFHIQLKHNPDYIYIYIYRGYCTVQFPISWIIHSMISLKGLLPLYLSE